MDESSSLEYRLRPELQRSCWYGIVGMMCVAVVAVYVGIAIQNRTPLHLSIQVAVYAIIATVLLFVSQWKLKVDRTGVWHQSFFAWYAWPWENFASGRIIKGDQYALRDPSRPWWRRALRLEYLESMDRDEVLEMINLYYQLPPPVAVADPLQVRIGFRTKITFRQTTSQADNSESGICLDIGGKRQNYSWQDVREAEFTRLDPLRRDFTTLTLAFPDREIEFKYFRHQGGSSPNWKGGTAEQLNELFNRMLPPSRIAVNILGKSFSKLEHVQRRIQTLDKTIIEMKWVLTISIAILTGLLLWMAFNNPWGAGIMLICSLAQIGPMLGFVWYTLSSQLASLKTRRDQLAETSLVEIRK